MKGTAARQKRAADTFHHYYTTKGDDRNDPLRNPGVLFQNLAFEKSIVEALRQLEGDQHAWKILDVGCGAGFSLLRLLTYGLEPDQLHGIDIEESRIARGHRRFPMLKLIHGDATTMDYDSSAFDLVMESTLFIQLMEESVCQDIANEMLRVAKPGAHIMLTDWRYSFSRPGYAALSTGRIARLFGVGLHTSVVCQTHGALIPVLGRFLSQYLPSLYFPISRLLPFLVGQVTVVLQKRRG